MTETSLPAFVQQMLKPDFYPHPVKEPIELIQTHVSYVFLTGDYVYKAKKPVNFGFLDYSTLEKRLHFCQEEIRLNQRGAAEIYLGYFPITQAGEKYILNGEGEAVDYVLKMVQFPQETLLSNVFEAGKLTEETMMELGRIVAKFHAQSPSSDYIRTFGEVAKIRESIDENYDQTEKYIGIAQTQAQFDQTRQFTDRFFAERQALLESRIQNNWIRECHGDLHIRNICLWNDKILLFDCIEFNEPFRFVDVMFDVAYAIMDMDIRQRPDLANAYLNTYIEQTGDWEGLQVLPLYLSRQSYVRAKVISFLLDDPGIPAEEKDKAAKTAAEYYTLAWQYTQPKPGKIILMSGISGSGKSSVAKHLARQFNAIQIRSDAVRKHLAGIPLDEKGSEAIYSPEMTEKTYSRLQELGIVLAKEGYTVILDAKYDRINLRQAVITQAQQAGIPIEIYHCTAPVDVVRDRLSARSGDISDATVDLLEKQLAAVEDFTESEKAFVKTIDTTQDWQTQLSPE